MLKGPERFDRQISYSCPGPNPTRGNLFLNRDFPTGLWKPFYWLIPLQASRSRLVFELTLPGVSQPHGPISGVCLPRTFVLLLVGHHP